MPIRQQEGDGGGGDPGPGQLPTTGGSGSGGSGGGGGGGTTTPLPLTPRAPLGFFSPQPLDTHPWTVENPPLLGGPIVRYDPHPLDAHPVIPDGFFGGPSIYLTPLSEPVREPVGVASPTNPPGGTTGGTDAGAVTTVNSGGTDPITSLIQLVAGMYAGAGVGGRADAPIVDPYITSQASQGSGTASSSGGGKLFLIVLGVALLGYTWYRHSHKAAA